MFGGYAYTYAVKGDVAMTSDQAAYLTSFYWVRLNGILIKCHFRQVTHLQTDIFNFLIDMSLWRRPLKHGWKAVIILLTTELEFNPICNMQPRNLNILLFLLRDFSLLDALSAFQSLFFLHRKQCFLEMWYVCYGCNCMRQ